VAMFAFLGNIVDWLSQTSPDTVWADHGWQLLGMGALILIAYPVLMIIGEVVLHQGILGNSAMSIRWLGHRLLLRQSLSFYQDEFAGRIATKLMQTALAVRDVVVPIVERMTYIGVYLIAALVLLAQADWRLSLPLFVWLIAYISAIVYFLPKLRDTSEAQADARSLMTGRVVDSYTNIATVKMFAHAEREDAYARDAMQEFLGTVHRQMRVVTWTTSTLFTMNALLLASVGGLSIYLWSIGAVSTGAIALSIGLTLRLQGMSQWILWEVAQLSENVGVVQDGMNTLVTPIAINDHPGAKRLAVERGEIAYQGVSFGYGRDAGVLDDLSLTVRPGEKIGVVGRSGAGKSTLVNLLLRLYDVETGRITIDGQDVSEVTQDSLRAAISVVSQDTALLHRSLAENIAYGRPDASRERIVWAAQEAKADVFLGDLEDGQGRKGLDAHAGERGVKLSGGQRQRIAIARVLLKDAPILVLDEATSALDSEVEAAIQENLLRLMEGKTVIAIAHRLSTIAALDRLIVMDEGRIIEQGTHDELVAANGLYAQLWARQSGGFLYGAPDRAPETVAAE
ncbi:MAG: ABC transporter ATP-binding protein, partial [Pseudomonadota bacterium]